MKKSKETQNKPTNKTTSKKKDKAEESDSSEEEKKITILKKKSIPQNDISSTQTNFNIQQSANFSMNLLKERGCLI